LLSSRISASVLAKNRCRPSGERTGQMAKGSGPALGVTMSSPVKGSPGSGAVRVNWWKRGEFSLKKGGSGGPSTRATISSSPSAVAVTCCSGKLLDAVRRGLSQPLVSARLSPQVRVVLHEFVQVLNSRECPNLSGVGPPLGELVEALGAAQRRERRVLVDELRDSSIDHRAGGVVGVAWTTCVVPCERGVDAGWVGVAVVVMKCAAMRAR
jgi:hypothetical protein